MHAQDGACGRKGFEWHVVLGPGMSSYGIKESKWVVDQDVNMGTLET